MQKVLDNPAIDADGAKIILDRVIAGLDERQRLALDGLELLRVGLVEIDAAPARIEATGEEVVMIVVKAFGKAVPIGHLAKEDIVYRPRKMSEFLD